MYKNLIEILNKKRITLKAYADFLGVTEKTVQNKVQGKTEFSLAEVMRTCSIIAPEYKIDFVFEKEDATEEAAEEEAGALAAATA